MCMNMYQPWKWLKRGNYSPFSHCRNGTKLLLALKVLLDDISPELQYLPRKYNSGFLYVPTEHKEMSQNKDICKYLVQTQLGVCMYHKTVFQAAMKLNEIIISKLPQPFRWSRATNYHLIVFSPLVPLGFMLMLWRADVK